MSKFGVQQLFAGKAISLLGYCSRKAEWLFSALMGWLTLFFSPPLSLFSSLFPTRILNRGLATLLVFSSLAVSAQTGQSTDLNGLWTHSKWGVASFIQNSQSVEAIWTELSPDVKNQYGFNSGDWAFRGTFDGQSFKGLVHLHYPVDTQSKCPALWDTSGEIVMTLSADGNTLTGQWKQDYIHTDDCSITDGGWQAITLTRQQVGTQQCQTDPASCGISIPDRFDEGKQAGIQQCQTAPSSCGITIADRFEEGKQAGLQQCQFTSTSGSITGGQLGIIEHLQAFYDFFFANRGVNLNFPGSLVVPYEYAPEWQRDETLGYTVYLKDSNGNPTAYFEIGFTPTSPPSQ